jgi:hypothetical protein
LRIPASTTSASGDETMLEIVVMTHRRCHAHQAEGDLEPHAVSQLVCGPDDLVALD